MMHIGTYAESGDGGLYPLSQADGRLELGDPDPHAPNASFAVYSATFDLHYVVDEQEDGAIRVLRREGLQWTLLARVPTHGALPCYLALDASERWLAVANYGSGSVALFELDVKSGLPGDPAVVHANSGHGPNPERQEGPHAHCAIFSPDQAWLFQTDLGTDQILAFPFDKDSGLGKPRVAFAAPPGSGPRHLVFHPCLPLAYLISELASTLTVLDVANGELRARQTISTLPAGFAGESLGGHLAIAAGGERLYLTNRGHDSIATFALDPQGAPSLPQHVPSGGASPRFFLIDEAARRLFVVNEEGGNVVAFGMRADGALDQTGEAKVPAPAFLFTT